MNIDLQPCAAGRVTRSSAFTLVEALVAMGVAGVMFMALYGGMTTSTFSIRLARENLRATQILLEKMEVIRLLTWDQLVSSNIVPTSFTAPYDSSGAANTTNGLAYTGEIRITPYTPNNLTYSADLRRVTVNVSWKSGDMDRSHQLSTYVSRYGVQNYIFN